MENVAITNAKYMLDFMGEENTHVAAEFDGTFLIVPMDPANRHYAEILRQVEAGTLTIQEAE